MGRVGINPARGRTSNYEPARVTVAVLTFIPHLEGYFAHRMDTLKLCLGSILKHTDVPYDLLVFDNASCREAREYLDGLQRNGDIRFLIRSSENLGKLAALRLIAGCAPGEVIAYSDDDAFFLPGWLRAHLAILDGFPKVGMVSGSPWRVLFDHGIKSNLRLAEADPEVTLTRGQFIPDEWETEYAESLGRDLGAHMDMIHGLQDIVLERSGIRAFAAASHNQFLIPREVLLRFTGNGWSGRLMGGMSEFDEAVDDAGFLRLTTFDRTVRNIGGNPSQEIQAEARAMSIAIGPTVERPRVRRGLIASLAQHRIVRRPLQGLYNRLFLLLSDQAGGWVAPVRSQDDDRGG